MQKVWGKNCKIPSIKSQFKVCSNLDLWFLGKVLDYEAEFKFDLS